LALALALAVGIAAGGARRAGAQEFPPDAAYAAVRCDGAAMTDAHADVPDALGALDIVGESDAPAGLAAMDVDFLYLRLRLDEDPTDPAGADGALLASAWGFLLDVDGATTTYEILIAASGVAGEVALHANTQTDQPNDPTDPADEPAEAGYPLATHARAVVAAGSATGGGDDFFLDVAVPWDDLVPLGVTPLVPLRAWAASSTVDAALDGDFACHAGADGLPELDAIDSDPLELDTDTDSDGDGASDAEEIDAGTDPDDPASVPDGGGGPGRGDRELEGGGGCAISGSPASPRTPWPWRAVVVLVIALVVAGAPTRARGRRPRHRL
jgi:hypothetical protein